MLGKSNPFLNETMNTTIKRPFIDFAAVKAAVSLTQILDHYGIAVDGSRTEVRMCCPIHGGTNPNEFGVNTERSIWKCFSQCGRGGNIFRTQCFHLNRRSAGQLEGL